MYSNWFFFFLNKVGGKYSNFAVEYQEKDKQYFSFRHIAT